MSENDAYTHQHMNPLLPAGAPVAVGWGHGQLAGECCSHCHRRGEHFQERYNCPSTEEQKALRDPLAPQDRTHILVALADCPSLLFEGGCTLLRSHLNKTVDRAEVCVRTAISQESDCSLMCIMLLT